MSEAYPHLVFHNFKTKLGERTMSILKYLFPVPKEDSRYNNCLLCYFIFLFENLFSYRDKLYDLKYLLFHKTQKI